MCERWKIVEDRYPSPFEVVMQCEECGIYVTVKNSVDEAEFNEAVRRYHERKAAERAKDA